ncbi:MAG: proteasome subunit alpha [Acidimicrobiia bacterium]|nr:proteasome subunit alpha [Acidimicrobiia bacterium]
MSVPFYVPPEQLMKDRAEYARKGIARGRSIMALEYENGVLLMGENTSGALFKISEIYDRVAFAGVGKYNEFEALRVAGIRHADVKGYSYARSDVTAKSLANAYSQTLGHIFTQDVKPYEVEILVVEVGMTTEETRLFHLTYDGTLFDERRFAVIGGLGEELQEPLERDYAEGMSLSDAVALCARLFAQAENKSIGPQDWEAAILDRTAGRRMFRRLGADDFVAAAL